MVVIVSSLGSYLRSDREDWTKNRWEAAVFDEDYEAENWILSHYGRNGLKFFRPRWLKPEVNDGDVA
jgi:hypothetical protein